jgi:hypothetical protein
MFFWNDKWCDKYHEITDQIISRNTRFWTLYTKCRQVIHKWRLESEMTILLCFLSCEGQYLKWTCFTAKTGLLPTDEYFAQEVTEPACDGITCPKYALWDSNPGSWLAKEQRSRLRFGGRRLLLTSNWRDETQGWGRHPSTWGLHPVLNFEQLMSSSDS